MAFPNDLTMVTVTHTVRGIGGEPLAGPVEVKPRSMLWLTDQGTAIWSRTPMTVPVADGAFTFDVPAVDQDNLAGSDRSYDVTLHFPSGPVRHRIAPTVAQSSEPVDLYDTLAGGPVDGGTIDGVRALTQRAEEARDEAVAAADPEVWDTNTADNILDESSATHVALSSTIDAATGGGITIDESVGTRVFVGGVMVYGDTGWRDITAEATNMSAGSLLVRRVGSAVTVVLDQATFSTTGTVALPRLGQGLRPRGRGRASWFSGAAGSSPGTVGISSAGYFNLYGYDGQDAYLDFRYDTDNPWPTSLPGSPA